MAFPPPFPNPMMPPRPQGQAPMMGAGQQKFGFFSPQTAAPTLPTMPMVGGIPIVLRPPRHPFVRKPESQQQYVAPPKSVPIPVTTVFIGNITDKCHDSVIQDILGKCGLVSNWKRLQDSNGKFKAFGFCDFASPEGARNALRVLKNYPLGDKRLNLKVDDETEKNLEEFAKNKLKTAAVNGQNVQNVAAEVNDELLKKGIKKIIEEKAPELLELKPPEEETTAEDGAKDGEKGTADRSKTPTSSRRKRSRSSSSRSSRGGGSKRSLTPKGRHSRSKRSRHHSSRSFSSTSSGSSVRTGPSKDGSGKEWREKKHSSRKASTRKRTPSSEDSDAIAEKRRLKREIKEREESYIRRLKKWEDREKRMAKQYEKDAEAEEKRQRTIQKEAKKLRQFLEDYQDERDDPKYYKGSALFDRRRNYEREREADVKDRHEERKELEEVKRLILKDQRKEESNSSRAASRQGEQEVENGNGGPAKEASWATVGANDGQAPKNNAGAGIEVSPAVSSTNTPQPVGPLTPAGSEDSTAKSSTKQQKVVTTLQQKTLQAPVNGVFEEEEEEVDTLHQIKKKIKPFEITREDRIHSLTPEERKKLIKDLISRIPTERESLFAFKISWEFLDEQLMEQRVRPWINKKIHEYIGEEEPSLVSFICEKIEAKTSPDDILQDLSMVLDDEADVFMVKLWRLIVYESEAKRLGLNVMPASKST